MSSAAELTHDTDGPDYELGNSPSHLIHRAQQFAADCYTETAGRSVLTQRQFAVLTTVAENEGLTQTALVRATGIDRSTLADLVARLVSKGLLDRERAPHDGRANLVRITNTGRQILTQLLPSVARADAAILAALPKSKRTAFLDALQRLTEVLDGVEAEEDVSPAEQDAKTGKKAQAVAKEEKKAKGTAKSDGKKKSSAQAKKKKSKSTA